LTVKHVTTYDEWKSIVDTGEPVVVDFHGEAWCAPCRRFAPTFTKVAGERPDITFVKVDVDVADAEIRKPFNFTSVPSVYAVKGNEYIQLEAGAGPAFLREVNQHVPNGDSS
jgi:thiol-disulfide isomerase/thioredoxin